MQTAGKILSIAGDDVEPFPGADAIVAWITPRGGLWSRGYYGEVAGRVDEVAVMTYDSALPWAFLYAKAVEWEARRLADLPAATGVRLLIGLPTHDERRWSFHPEAENLRSGLTGVRRAGAPVGVAVYADWTTDAAEWADFRELWQAAK